MNSYPTPIRRSAYSFTNRSTVSYALLKSMSTIASGVPFAAACSRTSRLIIAGCTVDLPFRNAYCCSSQSPIRCHAFTIRSFLMPTVTFFSASCSFSGRIFVSRSTPVSFGIMYTISLAHIGKIRPDSADKLHTSDRTPSTSSSQLCSSAYDSPDAPGADLFDFPRTAATNSAFVCTSMSVAYSVASFAVRTRPFRVYVLNDPALSTSLNSVGTVPSAAPSSPASTRSRISRPCTVSEQNGDISFAPPFSNTSIHFGCCSNPFLDIHRSIQLALCALCASAPSTTRRTVSLLPPSPSFSSSTTSHGDRPFPLSRMSAELMYRLYCPCCLCLSTFLVRFPISLLHFFLCLPWTPLSSCFPAFFIARAASRSPNLLQSIEISNLFAMLFTTPMYRNKVAPTAPTVLCAAAIMSRTRVMTRAYFTLHPSLRFPLAFPTWLARSAANTPSTDSITRRMLSIHSSLRCSATAAASTCASASSTFAAIHGFPVRLSIHCPSGMHVRRSRPCSLPALLPCLTSALLRACKYACTSFLVLAVSDSTAACCSPSMIVAEYFVFLFSFRMYGMRGSMSTISAASAFVRSMPNAHPKSISTYSAKCSELPTPDFAEIPAASTALQSSSALLTRQWSTFDLCIRTLPVFGSRLATFW